jgi:site-specific recombinase XerD
VLFVSLRNPHHPLKVGGIEIMMKRVGQEAGIDFHPHTLRHSFATHLIENNTSREFVQTMLGHRSSSSTEVYIHVSNKAIMGVKSPLDLPQKKKPGRKKKSD